MIFPPDPPQFVQPVIPPVLKSAEEIVSPVNV